MNSIKILGVKVNDISKEELIDIITKAPRSERQLKVSTLNPEIILQAHEDEQYYFVLGKFDIAIADGFGLKLAALTYGRSIHRITGADLVLDIFQVASSNSYRVAVVIRAEGLSSELEIDTALRRRYPDLDFRIYEVDHINWKDADLSAILEYAPQFLVNTLGAPYQEHFIHYRLKDIPSAKLAIGIGGALDFLTERIKRAPNFMRSTGFEWLWRLMMDPRRRFKRICNAVIIYSAKFLIWRYILPFFYRPNVACLLFKRTGDTFQILILERQDNPGHWQIPQGGKDGESTEVAGRRELNEEVGTDDFKTAGVFKNVHRYQFRYNAVKRYDGRSGGYKGQKQDLFIAEFLGDDRDIRLNHWDHVSWRWEDVRTVATAVHEDRRKAMEKFIAKFNDISKI